MHAGPASGEEGARVTYTTDPQSGSGVFVGPTGRPPIPGAHGLQDSACPLSTWLMLLIHKSTDDSQAKTHKIHLNLNLHHIHPLLCTLSDKGQRQGHAIHSNHLHLVLELTPACLELTVCLKHHLIPKKVVLPVWSDQRKSHVRVYRGTLSHDGALSSCYCNNMSSQA
ncbi:hypothetical protein PGT21_023591 [Puccinia graminis f. sp. tritici]|uniref:Uncharacterized protein n=1 Tax=Puccinia graminis f. sp. tritici TaxID=56615 RepID=A0A5B0LLA8_PUCGR|nr:hypothetical protein PGT21_023591 [Puccinia graminis f. sp. tritici]